MYESIRDDEEKALRLLQSRMAVYDFGDKEYQLCRKAYAFICENIRTREKTQIVESA